MASKTVCPVTRDEFNAKAPKSLNMVLNGVPMLVPMHAFSTGSLGWYMNGKTQVEVDGKVVTVQIGLNLTVVGSKDLPK
jgi:hypothetical protein